MSISTGESQFEKQPALKKQRIIGTVFSGMGKPVKNFLKAAIQNISGNGLEFVFIFSFTTTAIGELFGRDYSNRWYFLLFIIFIFSLGMRFYNEPNIKGEIKNPETENK